MAICWGLDYDSSGARSRITVGPIMPNKATSFPSLNTPRPFFRCLLLQAHLYCGLALSLYAIVMGISGGLLVFENRFIASAYAEFAHANPAPVAVAAVGPSSVLDSVIDRYPGWRALSVTWPNQECPYWMTYLIRGREALEVYNDQYGIVGVRDPSSGWLGALKRLHVNLFAGRSGRLVNGVCALALLALAASGTVLWFPGKRLRLRLRETHYAAGIASAGFISVLAFTGIYFVWPQIFVDAVQRVWGRTTEARLGSGNGRVLSLNELAASAQTAIPNRPIHRIQVVERADQPVRVTFLEGTPEQFHRVSTVVLDPVTGAILRSARLSERKTGDSVLAWLSALHFGVFGGLPVNIIWFTWALSLPLLSISGVLMWSKTRRKKRAAVSMRKQGREEVLTR